MLDQIIAIDLFCGAGGLTHGLINAGVKVIAGIDIDGESKYPYEKNHPGSKFIHKCITKTTANDLNKIFGKAKVRLLAGCCPCQPFSKLTNGKKKHADFDLISHFTRLIKSVEPEIVIMENVPELPQKGEILLHRFLHALKQKKYEFDFKIVNCEEYGVPQARRRFALVASRMGKIKLPKGGCKKFKTVRSTIGKLKPVDVGKEDPKDPLHVAAQLSAMNIKRIQHTPHDGGSRKSWPDELLPPCYKKESGRKYTSIYGRMWWDRPSPTITTLCMGLGNGRFGHPEQDRAMTLREAALLQSFPKKYKFYKPGEILNRSAVGRMIGNAVPPALGKSLGKAIIKHVSEHSPIK